MMTIFHFSIIDIANTKQVIPYSPCSCICFFYIYFVSIPTRYNTWNSYTHIPLLKTHCRCFKKPILSLHFFARCAHLRHLVPIHMFCIPCVKESCFSPTVSSFQTLLSCSSTFHIWTISVAINHIPMSIHKSSFSMSLDYAFPTLHTYRTINYYCPTPDTLPCRERFSILFSRKPPSSVYHKRRCPQSKLLNEFMSPRPCCRQVCLSSCD